MFVADGSFLVDGTLNTVYKIQRARRDRRDREIVQEGAEAAYVESEWRHAVAVRNGRVFCTGLGQRGELASKVLWLDPEGKPGEFGYMKDILRVYRVAPYR